jgi:predicted nucleic acid-binding protein
MCCQFKEERRMKAGLDTSVILRLLTGEPDAQARNALAEVQALIARGVTLLVSDLVVSEVYFALQHHYAVPKDEALSLLARLFAEGGIKAMGSAAAVLTINDLATANPGFVDRLIHAEYLKYTREVLTFEKAAARLPGMRVIAAK